MLFLAAALLFSSHHRFRLGLHADEPSWVASILGASWDFEQPLLLREIVYLAAAVLGIREAPQVAEIGRMVCAVAGAVGVVGIYLIVAPQMGRRTASLAALAAAITPLLAIHAHYFKDDPLLFAWCALAILAFRRWRADRSLANTLLLGACLGLAAASKEPGVFLVAVFALAIVLGPRGPRLVALGRFAQACLVGVLVGAAANIPMLLDPARALQELGGETSGIFAGHWDQVRYPLGFHFAHSLMRGVPLAILVIAVAGFAVALYHRFEQPMDRLMTIYAVLYYAVIDISPMKPWPDPDRYALPLLVALAYFFARAVDAVTRWQSLRVLSSAVYGVGAAIVVLSAVPTLHLVGALADDTRLAAEALLTGKEEQIESEWYGTRFGKQVQSVAAGDEAQWRRGGIRYLVASSFMYGRYAYGAAAGGDGNAEAERLWTRYQDLFRYPFCELASPFGSYAFSNPVIRIIDLQGVPVPAGARAAYDRSLGERCSAGPSGG